MARDKYHELVKQELIADGWTITDAPLRLSKLDRPVEIDLGAERLIGARRDMEIPKSDIILGFQAPIIRQDTEFAVG